MTWTTEHRATYRREGPGFPSDWTDAEWAMLTPLILQATPGGGPRKTDMHQAMNAILYLLRTGSPWRYLSRDGFPPRSTVYNIFRKFQTDGTWGAIWSELYVLLRERDGHEASPTAAVVDTLGLPIRLVVHSAAVQDRDGAALLLDKVRKRFPWMECVFADGGYDAQQTYEAAGANHPLRLEVVRRNPHAVEVIKRRWAVERTFSWLGRNRRLAKDNENLAAAVLSFVSIAAIQFGLRRLARK